MSSPVGAIFGALVAVILLMLFTSSTFYMVSEVTRFCAAANPCVPPKDPLIGEGFVYVVTTVGGLVSALVIAQLSVTEPGKAPTVAAFTPASRLGGYAVTGVAVLYLLAWIATGLAALVIGLMIYPKINQTLSDIGTTWLGLAVSAAYAYFGINPGTNPAFGGKGSESGAARAGARRDDEAPQTFALDSALRPGQKVPDTSEAEASGRIRKRIRRGDPEFALLVSNTNPDIVFKDEEGTGADRMMSPKLQACLDTLADRVAQEWSGVKLRVMEAWDENDEHSPQALHYEGRAADITTFPVDGAKLGRLARLAVESRFDWVLYEDTRHVHVSVKA